MLFNLFMFVSLIIGGITGVGIMMGNFPPFHVVLGSFIVWFCVAMLIMMVDTA